MTILKGVRKLSWCSEPGMLCGSWFIKVVPSPLGGMGQQTCADVKSTQSQGSTAWFQVVCVHESQRQGAPERGITNQIYSWSGSYKWACRQVVAKGAEKDSDAMEFSKQIPFMKGSARTQPQPVLFCGKWASITQYLSVDIFSDICAWFKFI